MSPLFFLQVVVILFFSFATLLQSTICHDKSVVGARCAEKTQMAEKSWGLKRLTHIDMNSCFELKACAPKKLPLLLPLRGGGRKSRVRKPRVGRLKMDHLKRLKPKGDMPDLTRGLQSSKRNDMDHYDHGDGAWQVCLALSNTCRRRIPPPPDRKAPFPRPA